MTLTAGRVSQSPELTNFALRPPEKVMRLDRMGSSFPTRLSFMRSLIRRMSREGWSFDRLRFEGELEDLRPALDGFAVMDLLDLNPGPKVGEIIDWLVELRFSDGFINREEASRRVRERWSKP